MKDSKSRGDRNKGTQPVFQHNVPDPATTLLKGLKKKVKSKKPAASPNPREGTSKCKWIIDKRHTNLKVSNNLNFVRCYNINMLHKLANFASIGYRLLHSPHISSPFHRLKLILLKTVSFISCIVIKSSSFLILNTCQFGN